MITKRDAIKAGILNGMLLVVLMISACGVPAPMPSGSQCNTVDDVRKNCGTCTSDRNCAWCATMDPHEKGCFARTSITCTSGTLVLAPDTCDTVPIETSTVAPQQ